MEEQTPEVEADDSTGPLGWIALTGCGLALSPIILVALLVLSIPVGLVLGVFALFPPLVPLAVAFAIGMVVIAIRDRRAEKKAKKTALEQPGVPASTPRMVRASYGFL